MQLTMEQIGDRIDALPPEEREKAANIVAELERVELRNRLANYRPYEWQSRLHALGKDFPERMARCANQVGKTFGGAAETAYHATGDYPDWWEGHRFDRQKNLVIWVGSKTNVTSRDIVQAELLGDIDSGMEIGMGAIPGRFIVDKPKLRQCGHANVFDYVTVLRKNGGRCRIQFLTYEMGWQKWQGKKVHFVWLDEEPARGDWPTDEDYRIFTEAQTRVLANKGLILVTFTPLAGRTPLVAHFDQVPAIKGTAVVNATWDDAKHLDEGRKAQLIESYPAHERAARSKGVPMVGSGLIWDIPEDDIVIEPFPIPKHFAQIAGCDFGVGHPAAGARIAYDRDQDVAYLIDCYARVDEQAPYHAAMFNSWGRWIPVAWPHDGHKRVEVGGNKFVELRNLYADAGANMLGKSARYAPRPDPKTGKTMDTGGSQPIWPIVDKMTDRLRSNHFKVFRGCKLFLEEYRMFHRDSSGKIVHRNEDVIKAMLYAMMMLRYAVPANLARGRPSSHDGMKTLRVA